MATLTKPLIDLLNKCDPPARVFHHIVPIRIIRVTAIDESLRTFRVEQLSITGKDPHNPRGDWHTLSTHSSSVEGGAFTDASKAAVAAAAELTRKLQSRMKPRLVRP